MPLPLLSAQAIEARSGGTHVAGTSGSRCRPRQRVWRQTVDRVELSAGLESREQGALANKGRLALQPSGKNGGVQPNLRTGPLP